MSATCSNLTATVRVTVVSVRTGEDMINSIRRVFLREASLAVVPQAFLIVNDTRKALHRCGRAVANEPTCASLHRD
jgi:hypothetical protein